MMMNIEYIPQTTWVPVKPWAEATKGYTPVRFVNAFGPCSASHVAARLGLDVEYVTRTLRRAMNKGFLTHTLRLTEIKSQMRMVAFFAEAR